MVKNKPVALWRSLAHCGAIWRIAFLYSLNTFASSLKNKEMTHFKIFISVLALAFMTTACSKSEANSENLIGDWKVARHTSIKVKDKEVEKYDFNFSIKFNTDGTCYRTQPVGTDTLFWALQPKQNILVIASIEPQSNLSGYRLNILKNEPNSHQWDDHIYTTYLMDTAWVPAVFIDTYDVKPK